MNKSDNSSEKTIPRLRADLDIIPSSYQGEKVFLVKDFLGLIPQPVLLRGLALQVIGLIDGIRNIQEIQLELMRLHGGVFIGSEDVEDVITQLDRAYLMDSQNYRLEKEKITREYAQRQTREAYLSGKAYPDNPAELDAYIRSILDMENDLSDALRGQKISAIIAPHIDLEIGKKIYAMAYQVVRDFSPENVLLLGTGHHLSESYFSLTTKDFVTPLGRVKTDMDEVKKLKDACPPEIIACQDIDHKNEHSLEFQILFLQHMFGDGFRILPVLCGSLHKDLHLHSKPGKIPGMTDFLSGLRHFLDEKPDSVLVVAGVDFSHIGPKFGHPEPARSMILEAKEHDRCLTDAICDGDVEAFWSEAQKQNNRYNVCGLSTLALLLELISGKKGHMLGYDFWMEDDTQSAVSYAAIAFPNP
jgi:AmmeMemoRadiSam system protein B